MELNETRETTLPVTDTLEVTESTESVETAALETTEPPQAETIGVVLVDVDRPFMVTSFHDYTVTEGLLLLIFVLALLSFFLNLFRR